MVIGGVSGDALQGVDAAEADVELVLAELVDRSGEALGDLAGPIELVALARLGPVCREGPSGEVGTKSTEDAGEERQRGRGHAPSIVCSSLRRIQAVLVVFRSENTAPIGKSVRGEPIRRQLKGYIAGRQKKGQSRRSTDSPS